MPRAELQDLGFAIEGIEDDPHEIDGVSRPPWTAHRFTSPSMAWSRCSCSMSFWRAC